MKFTENVLDEVYVERLRQDAKWGVQNHPSLDQTLLGRSGGCLPARMAEHYEIPSESRAKSAAESANRYGGLTFADILIEELSEAVAALDDEKAMRAELVQVAAVAVAWIEAIDRRIVKEINGD